MTAVIAALDKALDSVARFRSLEKWTAGASHDVALRRGLIAIEKAIAEAHSIANDGSAGYEQSWELRYETRGVTAYGTIRIHFADEPAKPAFLDTLQGAGFRVDEIGA